MGRNRNKIIITKNIKKRIIFTLTIFTLFFSGCTSTPFTDTENTSTPNPRSLEKTFSFEHGHFSLQLPSKYIAEDNIIKPKNKKDFNQIVFQITQKEKKFNQEELMKWEKDNMLGMCSDTDACGTITSIKTASINNVKNIKFDVKYTGRRIDEPNGFINSYHYTFYNNGNLYRFWTSANDQENFEEIKSKFEQIIDTLHFE